jgi:hypothetical protein
MAGFRSDFRFGAPGVLIVSAQRAQTRALAEACSLLSHHYATKQVKMAATLGQRSGDRRLAREAALLRRDISQERGVPATFELYDMTVRCRQLGFAVAG